MKRIKVWILKFREMILEGQIEHGQALLFEHRVRLQRCQLELRRVKQSIAMKENASTLLQEALRSRATR